MRKLTVLSVMALIGVISVIGYVNAYGYVKGFDRMYRNQERMNITSDWYEKHHERMEKILENGTYQDLLDYRNEIGMNVMPWVTDEESFLELKERHKEMEEYHKTYGVGIRDGNGFKFGKYRRGKGYGYGMRYHTNA